MYKAFRAITDYLNTFNLHLPDPIKYDGLGTKDPRFVDVIICYLSKLTPTELNKLSLQEYLEYRNFYTCMFKLHLEANGFKLFNKIVN